MCAQPLPNRLLRCQLGEICIQLSHTRLSGETNAGPPSPPYIEPEMPGMRAFLTLNLARAASRSLSTLRSPRRNASTIDLPTTSARKKVAAQVGRGFHRQEHYTLNSPDPIKITTLRNPTQCVLWQHPERIGGKFAEIFKGVEDYEDSSHLTRSLLKCKECGQLYFHEWYEWVDWEEGNDKMYTTLIPVRTKEEIETLKGTSTFMLMTFFPRLQLDGGPKWIGKD
jgi:hypothetical protein